jgi:hypothetical protein
MIELLLCASLTLPYVEVNACPGELCRMGPMYTSAGVAAYAREGDNRNVAFFLTKGERFTALRSDVYVNRFGLARVLRPFRSFTPGSEMLVLSYQGEGAIGYLEHGRPSDEPLTLGEGTLIDTDGRVVAKLIRYPDFTWWVQIRTLKGRIGWLSLRNLSQMGVGYAERIHWPREH